jgi:exodeoxyribonuclease VII small subunit
MGEDAEIATPPRVDESLLQIERIVRRLEREELELEDAIELYRQGAAHVISAQRVVNDPRLNRLRRMQSGLEEGAQAPR